MEVLMLTTEDNPFNPFDNFDEWNSWDQSHNYYTTSYLDRIAKTSPEMTVEDYQTEINNAVLAIASINIAGNYKVLSRNMGEGSKIISPPS